MSRGAIAQAEDRGLRDGLVYVSADNWHAGVIGIVAGRLKDRYNRPACVVALDQGVGKGSGRSVTGVDLGAAVVAARQSDLLINGGGHPMAAGFSVSVEREAEFATFLSDHIERQVGTEGLFADYVSMLRFSRKARQRNWRSIWRVLRLLGW